MSDILVSLIIPVYNSQAYLEKCLESAAVQTLRDIEIIIVDDGSNDGSLPIIEKFAAGDNRIKVMLQSNKGPGAARNQGLQEASGKYVAFMDSDDWVDASFLERMYESAEANSADIVMCNHKKVMGSLQLPVINRPMPARPSYRKALKQAIKDSGIRGYVWDKLYKRTLFTDNLVSYPQDIYYEDLATTFKLFYYSKKTIILKESLYYYLQRSNSISKKMDSKPIFDRAAAMKIMKVFLEEKRILTDYAGEFQYLCLKMWIAEIFYLMAIYLVTGSSGFIRDVINITRHTRDLINIRESKSMEKSNAKKLLTRT